MGLIRELNFKSRSSAQTPVRGYFCRATKLVTRHGQHERPYFTRQGCSASGIPNDTIGCNGSSPAAINYCTQLPAWAGLKKSVGGGIDWGMMRGFLGGGANN